MRYTSIVLAVAALAIGAGAGQAQNSCLVEKNSLPIECSIQASLTAQVPAILYLESNGVNYTFKDATMVDFDNGQMADVTHPVLGHKGNVPYDITASASAFTFTPLRAADGGRVKPVGDVWLTTGPAFTDVHLTTTGARIDTRPRGTVTGIAVPAKLALNWSDDVPGQYSSTITFTIMSN